MGIPWAIKDVFATDGAPTTGGSNALREHAPSPDAAIVRRLRESGAVLIGKTNLHELGWGLSREIGRTNNPHDVALGSGGSSGGSAATVACRAVPFAIGTDAGGSVRMPAAYCGVVGLKPTYGRISAAGVLELAGSLDHVGVFARAVEDCALALATLAVGDPAADDYVGAVTDPPAPRLGALASFLARATPEMGKHLEAVARGLEAAGARMEDVTLPEAFASIYDVGATVLRAEAAAAHAPLFPARGRVPAEGQGADRAGPRDLRARVPGRAGRPPGGPRGGGGARHALRRLPPADHRRTGAPRARLDGRSVVLLAVELPGDARHHAADRRGRRPAACRPARGRSVERGAAPGGRRLVRARDRLHRRPAALMPRA
jgi:Asp-tRNA(Asn)/Glu-tRNA(Gln) amidotransferase A subunit family amidase